MESNSWAPATQVAAVELIPGGMVGSVLTSLLLRLPEKSLHLHSRSNLGESTAQYKVLLWKARFRQGGSQRYDLKGLDCGRSLSGFDRKSPKVGISEGPT